jgi:hypothetical protein
MEDTSNIWAGSRRTQYPESVCDRILRIYHTGHIKSFSEFPEQDLHETSFFPWIRRPIINQRDLLFGIIKTSLTTPLGPRATREVAQTL